MMTVPLDGPRAGPAAGAKATSLVVLLHGYGADAFDLFSLARPLAELLPHAAFAAPNAPAPCEMGGLGFQWFGISGPGGRMEIRAAGADQAAPILVAYLETELARHGLDWSKLALIGFSQGTMMALHVGLRLQPSPAAIVGFSGMLVAPERFAHEKIAAPPILLVHGSDDPVVPFDQLALAEKTLISAGVTLETLVRPGLGHGIDDEGLRAASRFLAARLNFPSA